MSTQKALCIVQSWFLSWGVPYENRGGDLVVEGKRISFGPGGEVEVNLDAVLSADFGHQMAEMNRLMMLLGRQMPGLSRTPPTRRAASDDVLARSMRLTAFAKAPNPPEAVLREYLPIVKREADRAHRRCSTLNRALLLGPDDYLSVGMVFLTIYLHRYQDLEHESRNRADLTLFLQQEFNHWDKVLHHDLPALALDPRGLLVEQFMQAPVPGSTINWHTWEHGSGDQEREPSYTMPEYIETERTEPAVAQEGNLPHHMLPELLTKKQFRSHLKRCAACSSERKVARAARQRVIRAKKALVSHLANLKHDDFVEVLAEVMNSPYCDPEARRLAGSLFRKHMARCQPCTDAWWAWQEELAQRRKYTPEATPSAYSASM